MKWECFSTWNMFGKPMAAQIKTLSQDGIISARLKKEITKIIKVANAMSVHYRY